MEVNKKSSWIAASSDIELYDLASIEYITNKQLDYAFVIFHYDTIENVNWRTFNEYTPSHYIF